MRTTIEMSTGIRIILFVVLSVGLRTAAGIGILRSRNTRVIGSSQHPSGAFALSHAVDGSTRTDSSGCNCCAATQIQNNPWIQIDLGRLYRVGTLEVIGRTDWTDIFIGMELFVHAHQSTWRNDFSKKITIPKVSRQYYKITMNPPPTGRFVTLHLPSHTLLVVCEVNVYSTDCTAGTFGSHCGKTCGFCRGTEICDHVTGYCSKCQAGYRGTYCTDKCPAGRFGIDCSSICHCHENRACDHVTGACQEGRCDLGWEGDTCSKACHGTYGANCERECGNCYTGEICDRRTGFCNRCASGYKGQLCTDKCNGGTYGLTCSGTCGSCIGDQDCDHVTGHCTLCSAGYRRIKCDDVCSRGTFGLNCSSSCHCHGNKNCDYVTGSCPNGLCDVGWQGDNCSEPCHEGTYGLRCAFTCGNCLGNCDVKTGICSTGCLSGYTGTYCTNGCIYGFFGKECKSRCGNCLNNATCNISSGRCEDGCARGYNGNICIDFCPAGTFGLGCSSLCHCNLDVACDHKSGVCPGGQCALGWQGANCSIGYNIMQGETVKVSMSSVYQNLDATKAIDGVYVEDPEKCECCSETLNSYGSWWQAEFRAEKLIKQINVYGRKENQHMHLAGFSVFTSLSGLFNEKPVYVHNSTQGSNVSIYLPDIATNYVRIQRAGVLVICEIEIMQTDIHCKGNMYGLSCDPCGACKNSSCDRLTGYCPDGCIDGYSGDRCQTQTPTATLTAEIIGVVGGVASVLVVVAVIITIVCLKRYRKLPSIYQSPRVRWSRRESELTSYATLDRPDQQQEPRDDKECHYGTVY